jgi:hypothetical protein
MAAFEIATLDDVISIVAEREGKRKMVARSNC